MSLTVMGDHSVLQNVAQGSSIASLTCASWLESHVGRTNFHQPASSRIPRSEGAEDVHHVMLESQIDAIARRNASTILSICSTHDAAPSVCMRGPHRFIGCSRLFERMRFGSHGVRCAGGVAMTIMTSCGSSKRRRHRRGPAHAADDASALRGIEDVRRKDVQRPPSKRRRRAHASSRDCLRCRSASSAPIRYECRAAVQAARPNHPDVTLGGSPRLEPVAREASRASIVDRLRTDGPAPPVVPQRTSLACPAHLSQHSTQALRGPVWPETGRRVARSPAHRTPRSSAGR